MAGPGGIGGADGRGGPPRLPVPGFAYGAFHLDFVSPRRNGIELGIRGPGAFQATVPFERAWIGEREQWVAVVEDPDLAKLVRALLTEVRFLREIERHTGNSDGMISLASARILPSRDALPPDSFAPHVLTPERADQLQRASGRREQLAPPFSPLRLSIEGVSGFDNPRLGSYRALVAELEVHHTAHNPIIDRDAWAWFLTNAPAAARDYLSQRLRGRPLVDAGGNDFKRSRFAEVIGASDYLVVDRFALFTTPPTSETMRVHAVNDDALCTLAALQPRSVNVIAVGLDAAVIHDARWHLAFAEEIARVQHSDGVAILIDCEASKVLERRDDLRRVTDREIAATWDVFERA